MPAAIIAGALIPANKGTTITCRLKQELSCGGCCLIDLGLLTRAGIFALSLNVTVDEFDDGLGGVVAVAESSLHDAGIAAIPLFVSRADYIEEFLDLRNVAEFSNRLTPSM